MTRVAISLASGYLIMTSLFVYLPGGLGATTPSPQQKEMIVLLQRLFKDNPALESGIEAMVQTAKNLPDNSSLLQGVTVNPLMEMLLMGIRGLQAFPSNQTVIPGPSPGNNNEAGQGDLLSALSQNTLVSEVIGLVSKQIMTAQTNAMQNNVTIPSDMLAMLGLINPLGLVQELLKTHPARSIIPNQPEGRVNDACYRDIMDTLDSAISGNGWAIQMIDALGKPTAGIESGYFYFVGSYDQCYQIEPSNFQTRFCRANIDIPQSFIDSLNVDTHGVHLKLTWGFCLPDSCHDNDMKGLFELDVMKRLSIPETESVHCYEDEDITSDTSAIAAISVLSFFGVLILVGTVADICTSRNKCAQEIKGGSNEDKRQENGSPGDSSSQVTLAEVKTDLSVPEAYMPHKEGNCPLPTISNGNFAHKNGDLSGAQNSYIQQKETGDSRPKQDPILSRIVVCFSLYTNVPKILSARSSSGSIACVHGIRFLSLTWVMLGHTYNYGIISQDETFTTDNLLDFVPILQRFTYQGVVAGGFAVDTFFVLSAFLLTWLHLKQTDKKKKKLTLFDGIMYYFHRFWRLTPIYMLVIMSFSCLYRYIGSGPFWPSTIWAAEHCKTVWWTNLLYINNLVETHAQCMGWTWYLANDMQFYVISPIFLALMYIIPVVGGISTTLLLAMGIGIAFWKEFEINGNFFTMKSDGGAFWNEVYTVPWCRVGCWAVGMLLGFLIYKRDRKPLRNKSLIFIGWALSTAVALALAYSTFSENKEDGTEWTRTQRAFYEAFGRPAWGLCVSWVIFACYNNMGGLVNSLLSWNGFIPLSRLTYAAYLVHPICMMMYVFSRRTMLHVNDYNIIYLYLGHMCVTYMVALVCSAAFEAPAMALEKLLFHRKRRT